MVIYFKSGNELRERLKPDVDFYTRRVETETGKSIKEILTDIGINPAFVAFAFIDGEVKELEYIPTDEQTITLQPPVCGG